MADLREYNDQTKKNPTFVDKDKFNVNDYEREDDDDDDDDDVDGYENIDFLHHSEQYKSPLSKMCEILYFQHVLRGTIFEDN